MPETPRIFDRRLVRARRERAAANLAAHGFLIEESADRLADRLDDMRRTFPLAVELGDRGGILARRLDLGGRIGTLVRTDLSPATLGAGAGPRVAADEEALPFAPASLDAVLSNLGLGEVNDLPGALVQIRRALKPDGLLLASLFAGATLNELRGAFTEAEATTTGGASPRVAPFADAAELAGLLQRAGFAQPVVDSDRIVVEYADPLALLRDLKGMGMANALTERARTPLSRATLGLALGLYVERHADARTGRVPATFELATLTAWAPVRP